MKKKLTKVFISHVHADAGVIGRFVSALDGKKCEIFYSSDENKGINAGQGISATLDANMQTTDVFVPVITQKYIRSLYCLYELSVACFLKSTGKKIEIIPLCTSKKLYEQFSNLLARFDVVYICATDPQRFGKTKKSFEHILLKNQKSYKELRDFWSKFHTCDEEKGAYIGGDKDFESILSYCYSNGITRLTNSYCDENLLKEHVVEAEEITIVSTTGDSLIKTLKDSLVQSLSNGCSVNIVLPNQYSSFIDDVAASENVNTPDDKPAHVARLAQEFTNIFGYLKEAYLAAKRKTPNGKLGKVTMYCANNCFRQTITMTRKKDSYWVWCTFTMPPARAIDGTPSMMVEGKKSEKENGNVITAVTKHCETIIQMAKNNKAFIEIDENTDPQPFFLETETAKKYWRGKIEAAKENMDRQLENPEAVLIEVAAQHPLYKNQPNAEFRARLDAAIDLYKKYKKEKVNVKICVPGSIHKHGNTQDKISLSKAGIKYLVSKKIPLKNIYGEEVLNVYKPDGMYNSADECFAASKLFFAKDFTKLICICSPYQVQRKALFYIEFGIIPMCYCVSAKVMYHSLLKELFVNIPNVVFKDHGWQDKDSQAYINSRLERKPDKK